MTLNHVLAVLRSVGFRHVVNCQGAQIDNGFQLGANNNYRMWHPLLSGPQGSAWVGDVPELHVDGTGVVAQCFENVVGVPANTHPQGAGATAPRWTGNALDDLLDKIGRLRP